PRAQHTEPDPDVVHGHRSGFDTGQLVVLALETDRTSLRPHQPDHLDRLQQGIGSLTRGTPWPAHGRDRLPKNPGTPHLYDTAFGDQVQTGRLLGHDRRGP